MDAAYCSNTRIYHSVQRHSWVDFEFSDPVLTPGVGGVAVAAMAGPGRATVDHHLPEDGMQQRETLN